MKKRCLEMWEWLAETGGDKLDYKNYLKEQNRLEEYRSCWACVYDKLHGKQHCLTCPIKWSSQTRNVCMHNDSPYNDWRDCGEVNDKSGMKYYARKIVQLIKTTWTGEKAGERTSTAFARPHHLRETNSSTLNIGGSRPGRGNQKR